MKTIVRRIKKSGMFNASEVVFISPVMMAIVPEIIRLFVGI